MPISRITSITPKGSFPSEHGGPDGKLYSHTITFEDGTTGEANTKTPTPYYRQGEEMAYTIKSTNSYGNKLKIDKLAPGQSSPAPQQPHTANPSRSEPLGTPVSPIIPINGPTAGMGVKTALDILLRDQTHKDVMLSIGAPLFWKGVYEVASDVCRVMQKLEREGPAHTVTQRLNAGRPKPGPEGSVKLSQELDEDVPF
jgi:hypothetical protein